MAGPALGWDRHLTWLSVLALSCCSHQNTWQNLGEDRFVWAPGFREMLLCQGGCGGLNENVTQEAPIFHPWSPVGGGGLGSACVLEGVHHWAGL